MYGVMPLAMFSLKLQLSTRYSTVSNYTHMYFLFHLMLIVPLKCYTLSVSSLHVSTHFSKFQQLEADICSNTESRSDLSLFFSFPLRLAP